MSYDITRFYCQRNTKRCLATVRGGAACGAPIRFAEPDTFRVYNYGKKKIQRGALGYGKLALSG